MSLLQRVNAGGILSSVEVVGRDADIRTLWRILETQGIYLTGERRLGKSSLIRAKMKDEPVTGFKVVYLDVSDVESPLQFVGSLISQAKLFANAHSRFKLNALEARQKLLPGLQFLQVLTLPKELVPHWKEILTAVLTDFDNSGLKIVLAFDEMPLMLDKIKRTSGENVAMDILDTLRHERQSDRYKNLRMFYTGSLGLHHVIAALQSSAYQNSPLNDLKLYELKPLTEDKGTELALRLLTGMGINGDGLEATAGHIARITHAMPFYIQSMIGAFADTETVASPDEADRFITQAVTDANDPWDLKYFVTRIQTHYQSGTAAIALAFLDYLSTAQTPVTFDGLLGQLSLKQIDADEAAAEQALDLIEKDHYTLQSEDGYYMFRYPLIARAWAHKRRLTGRRR